MNLTNLLYRKAIHLLLILVPMAFYYLGKWPVLAILAPITAIFVSIDYLRRSQPIIQEKFTKILGVVFKNHEMSGDNLCGASYAALAACINFAIFKEEIAITAFLILAISDATASLVGTFVPSKAFFEKSLAGSLTFFITALAILFSCGIVFDVKFWFYFFGIFAVICTTLLEARPSLLAIDDNLLIPISFSLIMGFFDILWNYSY